MARALVNVPSSGVIGEIKASMMTLAQFQAQFGTNWVLANGDSATGTAYATITGFTTLPDARGVALRGKNNGRADGNQNPAGDLALGTFEGDQFQGHTPNNISSSQVTPSGGTMGWMTGNGNGGTQTAVNATLVSDGVNGTPRIGSETRIKSVVVNYFIKVN